jgi:hypothetical protein
LITPESPSSEEGAWIFFGWGSRFLDGSSCAVAVEGKTIASSKPTTMGTIVNHRSETKNRSETFDTITILLDSRRK